MKQLKFEHRKIVHYALLAAIILLQIIAIITWYNETKLSEAFDQMAAAGRVNGINSSIVKSQNHFNNYIARQDEGSLQQYTAALQEVSDMVANLPINASDEKAQKALHYKKQQLQNEIRRAKAAVDSIVNKHLGGNGLSNEFKFNEFETSKFLDDIKTDSYIKVDSGTHKGLFSRLGDAIANRKNVQKEYVNTVVTMQYKDKLKTGTVEQQMANAVAITNEYYAKEFARLKKSFSSLRGNDLKLMELNNELLALGQSLVSEYAAPAQSNLKQVEDQYQANKTVRSLSIVFLILLMLFVSLILFGFTRMSFEYEKQLTLAQEKIRQSLNFKNRITGMISHEIRSPLSIISMYSKKAGSSANEPELKETFKSIEFTTNSLLLLSNQILEYSKEENHEMELKPKNINLKTEIYQTVLSMTSLAESKGNALRISSNLKEDDLVYSDTAKIHQLFYNLIGNANKFTENGYIDVDINLESISDFEKNLKVVISDNGIGIAENDLNNIFDSYYQGTVSEKVNDLGVGLGLNICKEIIELFDGQISIESTPGKGTQVKFNLIVAQV